MREESKEEKLKRMLAQAERDQAAREKRSLPPRKIDGLTIEDWLQITGIPIGKHGKYTISSEGVFFETWSNEEIEFFPDHYLQLKMRQDNQHSLKFPCSERKLIDFFKGDVSGCLGYLPQQYLDSADATLSATDSRAERIAQLCASLYPDPMNVPHGGKAAIKKVCLKDPVSFTESTFKKAWQMAVTKKKIRMRGHDNYAKH